MPVSDNTYDLNPYKIGNWLLNVINRQPKIIVLLKALLWPFVEVHSSFWRYKKAKRYQLTITGQVCYLQRLLNDRFDFTERRIVIGDAEWHLPWYLYQEDELKDEWLFTEPEDEPIWLYSEGEAGALKDDFVVRVPSVIQFNEDEMKGVIDAYKLFGTKYKIERV